MILRVATGVLLGGIIPVMITGFLIDVKRNEIRSFHRTASDICVEIIIVMFVTGFACGLAGGFFK